MSFDIKRTIHFEHNVGEKDQKYRYTAGIVILLISVFMGNVFLLLLSIALIGSAYLTWCPVYSRLGKNTCDTAGNSGIS